jgi:hypothetical protein
VDVWGQGAMCLARNKVRDLGPYIVHCKQILSIFLYSSIAI